jgi:hypothetical protein
MHSFCEKISGVLGGRGNRNLNSVDRRIEEIITKLGVFLTFYIFHQAKERKKCGAEDECAALVYIYWAE